MLDCYKTLIEDFGKPEISWLEKESTILDECSLSSGTGGTIVLKDWTLTSAVTNQDVIGGILPDAIGCWSFAQWTLWAPYLAQAGFDNLQAYMEPSNENVSEQGWMNLENHI